MSSTSDTAPPAPSSRPRLLLFDTATSQATACAAAGEQVLAEASREVTTHSEGLLALIDGVLGEAGLTVADLDAIAVGRGPGSFTGLRIGLATAKGLCLAASKPLLCVDSLRALIAAGRALPPEERRGKRVMALLDARRGEVFFQLDAAGEAASEPRLSRPEELETALVEAGLGAGEELLACGDGAQRYGAGLADGGLALALAPEPSHALRARHLLPQAQELWERQEFADLASATPLYLRAPDIRKPKPRPGTTKAPTPQAAEPASPAAQAPQGLMASADGERSPADLAELVERLRQSGLRLDKEGSWWHEGSRVEHPGLARAFHRWLEQLGPEAGEHAGRFILRLDAERYCYVDVDDAPYVVRTVEREGEGSETRLFALLSDESREELDYGSLRVGGDDALYCTVKLRFSARFARQAQALLADFIDGQGEGFVLRAAGRQFEILGS